MSYTWLHGFDGCLTWARAPSHVAPHLAMACMWMDKCFAWTLRPSIHNRDRREMLLLLPGSGRLLQLWSLQQRRQSRQPFRNPRCWKWRSGLRRRSPRGPRHRAARGLGRRRPPLALCGNPARLTTAAGICSRRPPPSSVCANQTC